MSEPEEKAAPKAESTAVKPIPFHEWVIGKARYYELLQRRALSGDGDPDVDPLSESEPEELDALKERFDSVENEEFALLHLSEAIVGGVVIPSDHRDAVRDALVGAWRVFDTSEGEDSKSAFSAVKEALEVLGLPESELPKHIGYGSEVETADTGDEVAGEDAGEEDGEDGADKSDVEEEA